MTEFLELKELTPERQDEVIDLYRRAGWWFDSDEGRPDLLRRLVAGSHCFCIAVERGHVVGIGRAISDGVCDAYIQDVTVRSDFRRRGIGRALVAFMIGILKRGGLNWVGLIATADSRNIYARLGFEAIAGTPMKLKA